DFQQAVEAAGYEPLRSFPHQRLYVVGGLDSDYHAVDSVLRFDPLEGSWETLPSLSSPRAAPSLVVAAGRLFVLGGESAGVALQCVECFDPWGSCWEQLPAMGSGRIRAAAVACQGFIYVLGGLDGTNPLCSVERYDPKSKTWQEVSPMKKPRYACTATVSGGRIIVFGGELTAAGVAASTEIYDPASDSWQLMPNVKAPLCGASLVLDPTGQKAYTMGGLGLSGQALGQAERIDLRNIVSGDVQKGNALLLPSWLPIPSMPTARQLVSATSFQGGAVAVGGKEVNSEASSKVEFFNPELEVWEDLPQLPRALLRAAVVGGCL
ncbi:unnamed protein product, partial [Polarella glacialis]